MPLRFLKELRILWPGLSSIFVGAVLFAIGFNASLDWIEAFEGIGVFVFVFGTFLLACMGFDHEFQQRTLGMLLAQPISRKQLWREKLTALLSTLIVSSGLFALIASQNDQLSRDGGLWFFVCVPVCALATGPLYALLLRQAITATILSISVPFVLGMLVMLFLDWQFAAHLEVAELDSLVARMWLIGLGIYSCVCYLLGCWRMHTLQIMENTDKHLKLPAFLEHPFDHVAQLATFWLARPLAALVRKELALHRLNFLLGGMTVVFWFSIDLARPLYREWAHWDLLQGVLLGAYWVVITMTIGAIAVAEERSLGTHDWHQTLPVSTFRQWATKLSMALLVSLVLSVLLPAIFVYGKFYDEIKDAQLWAWFVAIGFSFISTVVSFYISTINRTTMGAVLGTLAVRALAMTIFVVIMNNLIEPFMRGYRTSAQYEANTEQNFIGLVLIFMFIAQSTICAYFSWRHYRNVLPGWRTIAGEFTALLLITAASIVMAAAIMMLWLN